MVSFVVSDIHGFYKYLIEALEKKGFFETESKRLIVCGDLLDRGKEAIKLVDFCLELKEKGELIYIRGNHEVLFMQALQKIARGGIYNVAWHLSPHYLNKTFDTLLQLAKMTEKEALKCPDELVKRVMESRFYRELLPSAVDYFENEKHIFCHGWIPVSEIDEPPYFAYDPEWRDAFAARFQAATWSNGMDMCCKYHLNDPGKTVVCGHWHASYGHWKFEKKGSEWGKNADHTPFYGEGIIAIDAATVESKTVNCIVIKED